MSRIIVVSILSLLPDTDWWIVVGIRYFMSYV